MKLAGPTFLTFGADLGLNTLREQAKEPDSWCQLHTTNRFVQCPDNKRILMRKRLIEGISVVTILG